MRWLGRVALVMALLAGCSGGDDFAYADVVEALADAGATVEEAGFAGGSPFSTRARLLAVSGHEVRVYEYPDVSDQMEETSTIGMDGWSVNSTPVEWIGRPHYWVRGRVIVLYLGDDTGVIETLTRSLGPPFNVRHNQG